MNNHQKSLLETILMRPVLDSEIQDFLLESDTIITDESPDVSIEVMAEVMGVRKCLSV